jgi:cation-transporting ATPase 13A1
VIVLVLLIFALISSGYVLFYGLEDEKRDKNKLFLRCILIVTTVVPPELPMILSIAVN